MATYRGFVESIQVRDDGWVEFVVQAVHAGNTKQIFFIEDLDGKIETAHKRLAQLSILRDALARVLPVEVEYREKNEKQHVVEDLTVFHRPSMVGRKGTRRILGTVIGMSIAEFGPSSGVSPYLDRPDQAAITLLDEGGAIEQVVLDLQRPDPMTGHAMLGLLREAFRTRRPIAVLVTEEIKGDKSTGDAKAAAGAPGSWPGIIQACEWVTVPKESLDYVHAFIERLGQRYESYEEDGALQLSCVRVVYTTAPGQTPEGDVSDNHTFTPTTLEALVHGDSPLLTRLETALRDRLQVKLGLSTTRVHEVELVGHLGSAARPVWIEVNRCVIPPEEIRVLCVNEPTIQSPVAEDLDSTPRCISWCGKAYFNEGIWRLVVHTPSPCKVLIDGEACCRNASEKRLLSESWEDLTSKAFSNIDVVPRSSTIQCHAYLKGVHEVELILSGRACAQPFQFLAYRIR